MSGPEFERVCEEVVGWGSGDCKEHLVAPCGSCGEPGPYVITLHGGPMPACLRHLNHWRTPAADYTCPTACVETSHPGREHHDWLATPTAETEETP